MTTAYVVQSMRDYTFLYCGDSGDIDHTPRLSLAGRFYDYEQAHDAGLSEIGCDYEVIPMIEE